MPEGTIISRHSLLWAQSNNSINARLVNLGTWAVVRVGWLWSIRQDALGTIDPNFAFGFCSGTAALYGDASATHFVGVTSEQNAFGGPWPLGGDNFLSAVMRPSKKVGVVQTNGTNLTTGWKIYANTTADDKKSMTIIEITKGAPNYSFKLFFRSAGSASNPTVLDLAAQIEAVTPAFADHTFSAAQTLAVDEGVDGTLDAIQIYWPITTSSLEEDAVRVFKVS